MTAGFAIAQTSDSTPAKSDAPAAAQDSSNPFGLPPPYKAKDPDKSEMPPEEDKTNAPRTYSFNPVQSKKEVEIGTEYFRKGNYVAAVSRFDAATKWNDGNADAWLMLGEAQEKKSNEKAARLAYQKYLELSPDGKEAPQVKKRLAKLKG
jgi:tetratricopeptide (TPR) repeat protein